MDEVYEQYEKEEEVKDVKEKHKNLDIEFLYDQYKRIERYFEKLTEELKDFGIEIQY